MNTSIAQSTWASSWCALGAADTGEAVRAAVWAAYAEPHRHYHTQQHLLECLTLFEEHRTLIAHPAPVAMALWFHDAVYDPRAQDNEAQSAAWAARALHAAGVPADTVQTIEALILATRHLSVPTDPATALLVDVDLAILGAPPERYADYETQIRAEYAWVEPAVFARQRRAVLERLQARQPLYQTAALRARLEAPARHNLAQALARLTGEMC